MSLTQDFELIMTTHFAALERRLSSVPSGLADQVAEVPAAIATFEGELTKLQQDDGLSQVGQARRVQVAYDAAQVRVENWRVTRTSGIDKQMAALRASLLTEANKGLPTPTDLQVTNMVTQLSGFSDLERELLYLTASDVGRRVIEAAAAAIGEQPVRHGDKVAWEPVIKAETITEAVAARVERANPDGAAALRDLQEIRNTFEALAGAAKGLLHASFPTHREPAPVA